MQSMGADEGVMIKRKKWLPAHPLVKGCGHRVFLCGMAGFPHVLQPSCPVHDLRSSWNPFHQGNSIVHIRRGADTWKKNLLEKIFKI